MAYCDACGGPVNDVVVKCPHCGEKRSTDPAVFSRAEIQTLIATTPGAHTDSGAMLKALLLPHRDSRAGMRLLELALAAVAAPAVLLGALGMLLFGRRPGLVSYGPTKRERSQALLSTPGEIAPALVMTLVGGGTMLMFGGDYALIAITAMWARTAVRMISAGKRERELIAEDAKRPNALPPARPVTAQPARPSASALPPARVISEHARPPAPLTIEDPAKAKAAVTAPAAKTPDPVKPAEPGDEPSLLR